ncbi:hypothetical protein WH843_001617 [Campylobacter coli]
MDYTLFILTFVSVSLLPGLCMSLAFSLGLSLGYKNTLWMDDIWRACGISISGFVLCFGDRVYFAI